MIIKEMAFPRKRILHQFISHFISHLLCKTLLRGFLMTFMRTKEKLDGNIIGGKVDASIWHWQFGTLCGRVNYKMVH